VKYGTTPLLTIVFLLALSGSIFAQGVQADPSPALPSGFLGPDLIAWSQMQTPRPVPQPLPPDQRPGAQEQPSAETFAGTIIKIKSSYSLRLAGGITYRLNDQDSDRNNVKQYEGQQVAVLGNLSPDRSGLRIVAIRLASLELR